MHLAIPDNLHAVHLHTQRRTAPRGSQSYRDEGRWPVSLASAVGPYRVMCRVLAMSDSQFDFIDAGCYGAVYERRCAPGVVFKRGRDTGVSDGWVLYARFVLEYAAEHGYCSAMPRIYHIEAAAWAALLHGVHGSAG